MRGSSRPRWTPYGVLALSLLLTAAGTLLFRGTSLSRDEARFRGGVESSIDRIEARLTTYVTMLRGAQGLFSASDRVTHEEFRRYVDSLHLQTRYPGIQGIGFSQRVRAADRAAFEAEQQKRSPEFQIWPESDGDELHTIVYLQPLDRRNRAAIGFDMRSEEARREAMDRARDTGEPAATRRVTLVQEIDPAKQAGFLIYVPVFREPYEDTLEGRREALLGYVYSPFRIGDLLSGIFGSEREPEVTFSIYDGLAASDDGLMYQSNDRGAIVEKPRFRTEIQTDIEGAPWVVTFRSSRALEQTSTLRLQPYFIALGLVISAVLFFLARAQARARAEAEVQRNNLYALFEQAPAAVAIVSGPERRYALSNPMNRELLGGREVIGSKVIDAFPAPEGQQRLELIDQVLRTGEPLVGKEVPLRVASEDGSTRSIYVSGTYQPLRSASGAPEGVMIFAYEVTEQVEARKRVEALAEDLKKAVRVRDEFLSIAGHELRTPLTALRLQLDNLLRQMERGTIPGGDSRGVDRVRKAAAQVVRLDRLVNELLDVSRITSGRFTLHLEEVELSSLAREVSERFTEQLSRAGCELRLSLPESVVGQWDRVRVEQVITNLLANAIKYGPGKPIEVTVEASSGRARLSVQDHGIGIGGEDAQRIFERFERAVSERNYGGLGLGLWISRQIVEALGGKIWFESEVGQGSTFYVELPYDPPASTTISRGEIPAVTSPRSADGATAESTLRQRSD